MRVYGVASHSQKASGLLHSTGRHWSARPQVGGELCGRAELCASLAGHGSGSAMPWHLRSVKLCRAVH